MADEVIVRPYHDRDLPAVLDTMRAALGEPPGLGRTPELFAWKHVSNPFGRSIMLVADAGGQVAGFRAFMRWELEIPDGTHLRCVRAVDTATHPDHQRKGIFRRLTLEGIDRATTDGVDLIFNTPNEKSGEGYRTMGWSSVAPIGVMVRPRAGMIRKRFKPWPEPGGTSVLTTIETGALDGLSSGHQAGMRTPRSRDYLRWRFGSHPTAQYVAATSDDGVAIGRLNRRNDRRELVISEVGGSRGSTAIRSLIRQVRPDYVVAWFVPGSPERRQAGLAGLMPIPGMSALTLVARPLRPLPIDVASLDSWDIGLGDLELL